MMQQQAARHDQILKNSLPISIPIPGPHPSCTAPVERAVKLGLESWTGPDGERRQCLPDPKLRRSAPAVANTTLSRITETIMILERGHGCHNGGADSPCSDACRSSCQKRSVAEKNKREETEYESDGDEDGDEGGRIDDFWEITDEIADRQFVLSLVEQLRQRVGYGEEDSPIKRAKQIEKAALKVSQLARVFTEEMQRSDGSQVVSSVVDRMLS